MDDNSQHNLISQNMFRNKQKPKTYEKHKKLKILNTRI